MGVTAAVSHGAPAHPGVVAGEGPAVSSVLGEREPLQGNAQSEVVRAI